MLLTIVKALAIALSIAIGYYSPSIYRWARFGGFLLFAAPGRAEQERPDGPARFASWRSAWRRVFLLALCAYALGTVATAQQLGTALWGAGYTRTLYLTAEAPHRPVTGPFNPNAVLGADRYGKAIDWHFSLGTLSGERASCATIEEFVRAGSLPGLDPTTFTCTPFDLADSRLVTRTGQTTAYDDMLRALPTVPPTDPPPSPTGTCLAPKVCMEAPGACPSREPCPAIPPPPACPPLTAPPGELLETLRLAPSWIPSNRPQQRRRVQAAYEGLRLLRCSEVVP